MNATQQLIRLGKPTMLCKQIFSTMSSAGTISIKSQLVMFIHFCLHRVQRINLFARARTLSAFAYSLAVDMSRLSYCRCCLLRFKSAAHFTSAVDRKLRVRLLRWSDYWRLKTRLALDETISRIRHWPACCRGRGYFSNSFCAHHSRCRYSFHRRHYCRAAVTLHLYNCRSAVSE